jgi:hypothetical protein
MSGCCPSRDYRRIFNQRFARRLANRYSKRGLDKTAQKMVEFLQRLGIEGATVLEIGGGIGELEIELLKVGAPLSRAFYGLFNLVMRLTRSGFQGFAHPEGAMLSVLEDHGLRRTFQRRSLVWQVAGLQRAS